MGCASLLLAESCRQNNLDFASAYQDPPTSLLPRTSQTSYASEQMPGACSTYCTTTAKHSELHPRSIDALGPV